MIALKSYLYTVFLNEIKKNPTVTVESGAFVVVAGVLPMELLGYILIIEYLICIKIENMLYGLWENSSNFLTNLRVHNIFHLVR